MLLHIERAPGTHLTRINYQTSDYATERNIQTVHLLQVLRDASNKTWPTGHSPQEEAAWISITMISLG